MRKQDPPFCIQVELCEGCNLFCDFCGLTSVREEKKKKYRVMTTKTANNIAANIATSGWTSRIEFAQHGEPTMNPKYAEMIKIFRHHLPNNQLMMTSNGGGLIAGAYDKIQELFDNGLNILALDWYEYVKIVPKILKQIEGKIDIHYYPDDLKNSPHTRHPKKTHKLIVVRDISKQTKGNHATLNNHSGAASPLVFIKDGKRCAKPFREMSIHYDGKVNSCCQDWFRVMTPGDANKEALPSIWNGAIFKAMRKKLYHGQRDFPPCYGCNYVSYRNGLLPDKFGKESLPKPSKRDNELLKSSYSKPLTRPVSPLGKSTIKVWNEKAK